MEGQPVRKTQWSELTTVDFAALDPATAIAVLPIAAIEQHGPHLPVATDTAIAEGMLREVTARLPDDLTVLVLPVQAVGKSNEHLRSPGTLTLSAETALGLWVEIGESVHRAGLRKLVIVTSHGGNVDVMGVAARELRVRCGMLAVCTAWSRFGQPPGLYGDQEVVHGIHGGDIETSLMLHFRPELVRTEAVANFAPSSIAMENEFAFLRPTGRHAFGWIAQDLHPSGAAGDASAASAEKGRLTAQFQAEGFVALLRDVARFPLERLA
jgi:creatinine amidohydrolase